MGGVTGLLGNLAAGALLVAALLLLLLAAAAIYERAGSNMAILGKEQIFAADDIKTEIVAVPEWGGEVIVRGLSGHQRDEWEKGLMVRRGRKFEQDMTDFRTRLAVLCIVDEKGELLFHAGDIHQLAAKSGAPLDRIYAKAAELSGISDKDLEDLTKDFGTEPGGGGSSTT